MIRASSSGSLSPASSNNSSMATWCPPVENEEFDLVAARVASTCRLKCATTAPTPKKRCAEPHAGARVSPRDYLHRMVSSAVDPPYAPALDIFYAPAARRVAAYTPSALAAVRGGAWSTAVCAADASNKFGVTLLHKACRASNAASVVALLAHGAIPTSCDAGRVPLHDAIWTTDPDFDLCDALIDAAPDQLFRTDTRGFTAMDYAPRETWPRWCDFLGARKHQLRTALAAQLGGTAAMSPATLMRASPRKCGRTSRAPAADAAARARSRSPSPEAAAAVGRINDLCAAEPRRSTRSAGKPTRFRDGPLKPCMPDAEGAPLARGSSWPSFTDIKGALDTSPASYSASPSPASSYASPPSDLAAIKEGAAISPATLTALTFPLP